MDSEAERQRILRFLRRQMSPEEMKSFVPPPNSDDVDDALSGTGLEAGTLFGRLSSPFESEELEAEILQAYVEGRATEDQRRMVDAMIQVDPRVKETIQIVRQELELAETWTPPSVRPDSVAAHRPGPVDAIRNLFARAAFRTAFQLAVTVGITAGLMILLFRPQPAGAPHIVRVGTDTRALVARLEDKDATIGKLREQLAKKEASHNRSSQSAGELRVVAKDGGRSIWLTPSGRVAMDTPPDNPWNRARSSAVWPEFPHQDSERGADEFALHGQPDRCFVLPDHVTLSWRPPNGPKPASYHITLESDKGVELPYTAKTPEFSLPNRLEPGVEYTWKVAAGDGPDAPVSSSASFRTLTESQIKQARKILASSRLGALEKAEGLARLGLQKEAEREFNRVDWLDQTFRNERHKAIFGR